MALSWKYLTTLYWNWILHISYKHTSSFWAASLSIWWASLWVCKRSILLKTASHPGVKQANSDTGLSSWLWTISSWCFKFRSVTNEALQCWHSTGGFLSGNWTWYLWNILCDTVNKNLQVRIHRCQFWAHSTQNQLIPSTSTCLNLSLVTSWNVRS